MLGLLVVEIKVEHRNPPDKQPHDDPRNIECRCGDAPAHYSRQQERKPYDDSGYEKHDRDPL
jgi:hypothetical protein